MAPQPPLRHVPGCAVILIGVLAVLTWVALALWVAVEVIHRWASAEHVIPDTSRGTRRD